MNKEDPIVGRFAPSPTGPLHFGSLVAALGSYLAARSQGGRWLVRMEDLDKPREVPGAAADILRTLDAFGFHWDGDVMFQSRRTESYRDALQSLSSAGLAYACVCSRREIAALGKRSALGLVYPGRCRERQSLDGAHSIRVRTDEAIIEFHDRIQGRQRQDLGTMIGDFVIRRADALFAYQLAVVVDDAEQGINQVVRGSDLLDSTPRQIHLQRKLGLPQPDYSHLPLAVTIHGEKLSKLTSAPAVDRDRPGPELLRALNFLGQSAPRALASQAVEEILAWAARHWRTESVPAVKSLAVACDGEQTAA